jgi:DNA-binding GntR family transcriptional regulator
MMRPTSDQRVRTLADQVYDHLRVQIVRNEWPADKRIVELEIAAAMGTSQGPVREALQRLEREGLVDRHVRNATYVSALRLDEMYELFSIRSVIEGFAIRRTAACITDAQCDELDQLLADMREAGRHDDMFMLTEHDLLFHRRICQWSGSAALLRAWDPLYSQIQRFVVATHAQYFPTVTAVADTHAPIVEALRARAVEHVTQIVQDHVMLIWALFEKRTATAEAGDASSVGLPPQPISEELSHAAANNGGR